jgi:translation initiation factor 2B subunit (eIF-2B alpha/beta/delta family)
MAEHIIKQIAEDNRSGAAEILHRASEAISLIEAFEQDDVDNARRAVIETCAAIARAQPDMAPLVNLASTVVRAAHLATSADEVIEAAAAQARAFSDNAERMRAAAVSHAAGLIGEGATILTHSRSSTVLAALNNAKASGKCFRVIATESRPMLEGRAMAESLARSRISVSVIADAAAAAALEKVDCVLIGADKVTPEDLINKMGTRMIALAARERNRPAYAICDTSKFTCLRPSIAAGQRSADELWPSAPQGIEVLNRYFEPTPLDYFTAIVTEGGGLRPEQARERAQAVVIHQALLDALDKKSM